MGVCVEPAQVFLAAPTITDIDTTRCWYLLILLLTLILLQDPTIISKDTTWCWYVLLLLLTLILRQADGDEILMAMTGGEGGGEEEVEEAEEAEEFIHKRAC